MIWQRLHLVTQSLGEAEEQRRARSAAHGIQSPKITAARVQ